MYYFNFYDDDKSVNNTRLNQLIKVEKRPDIESAEEIIESTTLGDGTVAYKHTGIYKDRSIKLSCNFVQKNKDLWMNHFGEIQKILLGKKGKLVLSDDANHYWQVINISIDSAKRSMWIVGNFNITFTVKPYRYIRKDSNFGLTVSVDEYPITFVNEYINTEPKWIFKGNSSITKISIRRGEDVDYFVINDPFITSSTKTVDNIEVDIDKWTTTINYTDGTYTNAGTKTEGFYDNLRFDSGNNEFILEKTGTGDLEIKIDERLREF